MKKYKAYNNSGYSWVGSIPEDWSIEKIKHLCSVTDGTHFSPQTELVGKPYITVSNVNNNKIDIEGALHISDKDFENLVKQGCQPKVGDVLLAKDGTVGRSAIVGDNNDFVCLSSLGILSPGDKLNSSFLKYSLDSNILQEQMKRAMAGSALKRITISKIEEFVLVLPSINEQEVIARYLDHKVTKIDASIDAIDSQIEDLKKYRKSIISEAVTKGLDKSVPMKDSGVEWIGEVPASWSLCCPKYNIQLQKGRKPSETTLEPNGDLPYLTMDVLRDRDNSKTEYPLENIGLIRINEGQILVLWDGANAGEITLAKNGYLSSTMALISHNEQYHSRYLYYLLKGFEQVYKDIANGTTIPHLDSSYILNYPYPIPSLLEQESIAGYLDAKTTSIDSAIDALGKQKEDFAALKQSIISEAVTGKIDVRDWKPSNE